MQERWEQRVIDSDVGSYGEPPTVQCIDAVKVGQEAYAEVVIVHTAAAGTALDPWRTASGSMEIRRPR